MPAKRKAATKGKKGSTKKAKTETMEAPKRGRGRPAKAEEKAAEPEPQEAQADAGSKKGNKKGSKKGGSKKGSKKASGKRAASKKESTKASPKKKTKAYVPKNSSIIPYFIVDDVAANIEWMEAAFGAVEVHNMKDESGKTFHAEYKVGGASVMLGSSRDPRKAVSTMVYLYVDDADAAYAAAMGHGATSVQEPKDMFYGDRNAAVKDPCGNEWWLAQRKEDLSKEEIIKRGAEEMAGGSKKGSKKGGAKKGSKKGGRGKKKAA